MNEPTKFHVHLSGLIAHARLQNGFATLKELYRAKKPSIDYQTWLHAEAGRRIPASSIVLTIGEILNIDREALIIAYCKDKFDDPKSHKVFESLQHKKFIDMDTLIKAKDYDRSEDYVFTGEQLRAIQKDIRLRLYLMYTYDRNLKTTMSRLAQFFKVEKNTVKEVIENLQSLGLVEVIGEEIKRIHPHTTLPNTADVFDIRRQLMLKDLELNIKSDSYMSNFHLNLTEKSYKQILAFFDFVEANLIKLGQEDQNNENSFRFQIAIAGNRLYEGSEDDRRK